LKHFRRNLGVAPRHDAEAVVLDLVQPFGAGRLGFGW
jgi:hypothetical protein